MKNNIKASVFSKIPELFQKFESSKNSKNCLKPKQHRNHMISVYIDQKNESFCTDLLNLYPTQIRLERFGNMIRVWISESLFELIQDVFYQKRFQTSTPHWEKERHINRVSPFFYFLKDFNSFPIYVDL